MKGTVLGVAHFKIVICITMTVLIVLLLAMSARTNAADIHAGIQGRVHDLTRAHNGGIRQTLSAPLLMQQFARLVRGYSRGYSSQEWLRNFTILGREDSEFYRKALAAVRTGRFRQAEMLLTQTKDHTLRGHVLAEQYLSHRARPDFAALSAWMALYNDLPQARRIYATAMKLKPDGAHPPALPNLPPPLLGMLPEDGAALSAPVNPPLQANGAISADDRALAEAINLLLRGGKFAEAAGLLHQTKTAHSLDPKFLAQNQAAIAAAAFFAGSSPAKEITALPEQVAKTVPLAAWVSGLQAWRDRNFDHAARHFGRFAAFGALSGQERAAGLFWQARALAKLGDDAKAKGALHQAATWPRSFYGLLARAQLGMAFDFGWETPELTPARLQALAASAPGRRGLALLQIDEPELATGELRHVRANSHERALALVALAHEANLPALSLSLGSVLKTASGKLFDSALYPLPPWQPAADTAADRAFIYAVMRHESGFDPAAISQGGAHGLMQLMPRTAGVMATPGQIRSNHDLLDPAANMMLGIRYIRHLAGQKNIDNNLLLLTAAYNGGPGNLMRWLKVMPHGGDPLYFIEILPFRETRDYIERVLGSYWIYRARLGESQYALHELAKGQWPNFAAAGNNAAPPVPTAPIKLASN